MSTDKVEMIAEARFTHEKKRLLIGEKFMATEQDAKDLRAMKMARRSTVAEKVSATLHLPGTYRRRDMKAES